MNNNEILKDLERDKKEFFIPTDMFDSLFKTLFGTDVVFTLSPAINDPEGGRKIDLHNSPYRFVEQVGYKVKTPDDYRAQGVEIMREKTLQAMERAKAQMDPDDWKYAEQVCLGMVDGCNQVIKEILDDTLPEKFRNICID